MTKAISGSALNSKFKGGVRGGAKKQKMRQDFKKGTASSRFPALSKGSKPFKRGTPQAKAIAARNK